jgi:single-stranded-DNA-specific exonuclease
LVRLIAIQDRIKALVHSSQNKPLILLMFVFIIAPRINIAGRIKHGNHAVELLTEFDFGSVSTMVSEIEQYNSDRKDLDKQITKEALLQIEVNEERTALPQLSIRKTIPKA